MDAYALVNGDLKQFKLGHANSPVRVAFAVVETTDANAMLARVHELVPEVVAVRGELSKKSEAPIDCMFLAIVDIVELRTHCIVAGQRERSLATAAGFNSAPIDPAVEKLVGVHTKHLFKMAAGKVSRKADFIPPLTNAVDGGWSPSGLAATGSEANLVDLGQQTQVVVDYEAGTGVGRFVRCSSTDPVRWPPMDY